MDKNRNARLLTKEEISKLSIRKDLITVSIDVGEPFDKSKEITHKEFSDFLYGLSNKYQTVVIEEFLYSLAKIHDMKAEKYQNLKVKPEIVYRIMNVEDVDVQKQTQSHPDMYSTMLAFVVLNKRVSILKEK